ncbi:MAG: hypothetical protein FWG53_03815 [Clostridiales bacterium]|nr:hypothetical protein [Clostridiales bacterium]
MYSKLPNLIIAFHGCDLSTYENVVLKNESLEFSKNDYDWLGNGIYFWESNRQRANEWAEEKVSRGQYYAPAVIGAVVDLGFCLNLTDSAYVPILKDGYELLKMRLQNEGKKMPVNKIGKDRLIRELDCAVIEQIHDYNHNTEKREFDSVRGIFIEGDEVYAGSGFNSKTHVQICIRNPNCIKGYFSPLSENIKYILP